MPVDHSKDDTEMPMAVLPPHSDEKTIATMEDIGRAKAKASHGEKAVVPTTERVAKTIAAANHTSPTEMVEIKRRLRFMSTGRTGAFSFIKSSTRT